MSLLRWEGSVAHVPPEVGGECGTCGLRGSSWIPHPGYKPSNHLPYRLPTILDHPSQVLRRAYSKEADIWSCGVMLYILLCGFPPFHGDNEKKIFEAVISKPLDFQSDPWPKISGSWWGVDEGDNRVSRVGSSE